MNKKIIGLGTGFVLLSVLAVAQAGNLDTKSNTTETPILIVTESAVTISGITESAINEVKIEEVVSEIENKTSEEAITTDGVIVVDKTKYNIKKEKFILDKKFEPEIGTATWYGGRFHGRKTSSGEVFNKYNFTAAHRNIPLGTLIKVTNLRTGEFIIVKVNDTCHAAPKRIMIDLSEGAFKKLATKKDDGLMKVKIERLKSIE